MRITTKTDLGGAHILCIDGQDIGRLIFRPQGANKRQRNRDLRETIQLALTLDADTLRAALKAAHIVS